MEFLKGLPQTYNSNVKYKTNQFTGAWGTIHRADMTNEVHPTNT